LHREDGKKKFFGGPRGVDRESVEIENPSSDNTQTNDFRDFSEDEFEATA